MNLFLLIVGFVIISDIIDHYHKTDKIMDKLESMERELKQIKIKNR